MRRKSLTLLVVIVTLAIGSLLNAPTAYSASWYDGKILSTQRLEVLSVEGTTDLTTDWRKVFRGILDRRSGDPSADEMLAQFNANQSSGAGWLVQSVYQGMRVITFNPDATITFDNNWNGYLHLMFSTGRVSVWETGGHSWKNWRDLDASPKLEGYVSVECSSYDTVNPSYVQYDIGLTAPAFRMPYLFIASGNIQYPAGYEGVPIRTAEPGAKYVAMGDSYSSGEGHSPFEVLTDVDGVNECHRSTQAYPRTLQSELGFDSMAFVACSGAVTHSVLYGGPGIGNWSEGAQTDVLSSDTEAVTITIGGNDLGFKEVIEKCSNQLTRYNGWGCSSDTNLNDTLDYRLEALDGTATGITYGYDGYEIHSISEVIEAIETEAPNASIYIAGYPKVFGSSLANYEPDANAPGGGLCVAGFGVNFSYQDAQWMNGWADSLNGVISDAVAVAKLDGVDVEYITPNAFNGHGLCDSGTPYIYDVAFDSLPPEEIKINPSSFHPNADGMHLAYGMAFLLKMS